jgi:1,4-dihydroxy-2-naphthoyl-CoA synthase
MSLAPDPVLLDVSAEGVAVVTLNVPEKRNAFDELVIANLTEHFETLKGADHVRVVFLRGAGESFCAGADIEWMRRQGERDREENEADALSTSTNCRSSPWRWRTARRWAAGPGWWPPATWRWRPGTRSSASPKCGWD